MSDGYNGSVKNIMFLPKKDLIFRLLLRCGDDHLVSRKLYISIGWMDTVKDFSILVPSYIRDRDICFRSVLGGRED